QRRVAERFHQPRRVVLDIVPLRHGADQRHIGTEAGELTLDVIHRAEENDAMAADREEIRQRAAFLVLREAERRSQARWNEGRWSRRLALAENAVPARNYPD